MRRFKTGVVVAGALAAVVLVVGAVSAGAESGPKCADITAETHTYRGTGTTPLGGPPGPYTFAMELLLAAPACKSVVYTVYRIQDPGDNPTPVLQDSTLSPLGNPTFTATGISDDDPNICVYATSASKGGHIHDRAPDTGCLALVAPASGGGSGFS